MLCDHPLELYKYAVESACNEHGYNKFPPITKSFSGTDFSPVVFNIKKHGYNESGYSEITLITKAISPPLPQSDEFPCNNEVTMDLQGCAQKKLSAVR